MTLAFIKSHEVADMSQQKNKIVITITIAIVSALLLGGISFSFFPSQSTAQSTLPTISSILPIEPFLSATNSISSTSSFQVFFANPLNSITIEANGRVNSTTAPIQRNGNVYTLTQDVINQTINVQSDNIIIDGAGHTVQGFNYGNRYALEGFDLQDVHNVTIKNFQISLFWQGVWIQNCSSVIIQDNVLSNVNTGVDVNSANDTTVTGNTFGNSTIAIGYTSWYGFGPSVNNIISKNNITDTTTGITMSFSYSNTIIDNVLVNVVDPIGAGDNGTVARNTMVNGIDAIGVSSYSVIYENNIFNFSESGLSLGGVNSTIYENTVANCSYAVMMSGSSDDYPFGNNTLYHNNFVNDSEPLLLLGNSSLSINYWDNGKEGNYWSSYNGTARNGDDIGDTPYTIGGNNTDEYPLIQPYLTQSVNIDTSKAQLFFVLAIIIAAVGAATSLCLYINSRFRKRNSVNRNVSD